MLEISLLREQKERVLKGLKKKHQPESAFLLVDEVIRMDDERKQTQTRLDGLLFQINTLSGQIGDLFKTGKASEANDLKNQVNNIKEEAKELEITLKQLKDNIEEQIIALPNIPNESVPEGRLPSDNTVHFLDESDMPSLDVDAIPHWEIAEKYNIISFKSGVTLTGAGYPLYINKGARLQRALINFFLEEAIAAGYTEYQPPIIVNKETMRATGQLPDKEGQMYHCEKDDLYLIPTAEVPLTNIYRDAILSKNDFPLMLTGYTPCFRREAGSYGSDVKGLNRLHQFDKIEIVQIQHPDDSYNTLMEMVQHVENLVKKLKLPYRILRLCGGDMSFASALTFDFETYSAAQGKWLEVSSVSNFETFQSNRMKLRFRDEDGKTRLAHTLNGSALALPRIVATILENYQTKDGVLVPEVLQKYTGFNIIN
ncbi:MAG: serine--tRNA ligase [Saprospiraceae bacterium]|nr:serine--tRNA ligase [Saprospiraceae bacterium]MBK6565583.1 serine--tRNA ligase [Saprospiraceae bacterium]MBK8081953.1 serine--tRNA ligase [Saprospiraceae bacterium]MBK8817673.1 serine--tRNA ligase [Saprospiraceae bacterium]MBP6693694.1 serine--tRNA ligase [Saprospiraceae bacterium]